MDLTTEELYDYLHKIEIEIAKRKHSHEYPIFVISYEEANSCFKNKEDAIKQLSSTVFNYVDKGDEYLIKTYVRWISKENYDECASSWLEV